MKTQIITIEDIKLNKHHLSKLVNEYEITIERLLFGDFYIAVYKDQQLILDRKYYVNDPEAAVIVFNKLVKKYLI